MSVNISNPSQHLPHLQQPTLAPSCDLGRVYKSDFIGWFSIGWVSRRASSCSCSRRFSCFVRQEAWTLDHLRPWSRSAWKNMERWNKTLKKRHLSCQLCHMPCHILYLRMHGCSPSNCFNSNGWWTAITAHNYRSLPRQATKYWGPRGLQHLWSTSWPHVQQNTLLEGCRSSYVYTLQGLV